jgi:spore germination protein GerM
MKALGCRRSVRGVAAGLTLAGLATLASACGVPLDTTPTAIPAVQVPAALSVAPASTLAPAGDRGGQRNHINITIYLVNGLQQLVEAIRPIKPPGSLQAVLTSLAGGPDSTESSLGYSTDLPVGVSLMALGLAPDGVAEVQVGASFLDQGGQTAINEYAQVVLSLSKSLSQVKAVQFYAAGSQSGALLANDQLVFRPVTPADYRSLQEPTSG